MIGPPVLCAAGSLRGTRRGPPRGWPRCLIPQRAFRPAQNGYATAAPFCALCEHGREREPRAAGGDGGALITTPRIQSRSRADRDEDIRDDCDRNDDPQPVPAPPTLGRRLRLAGRVRQPHRHCSTEPPFRHHQTRPRRLGRRAELQGESFHAALSVVVLAPP